MTVDHLTMNGTTSGIRMKSARDRGGLVHNLTYSNITMTNVQNPVFITSYYPTLPTDPTTDTAMAITATTPIWQNITIKNLTATGSTNAGILWGLPEEKISVVIRQREDLGHHRHGDLPRDGRLVHQRLQRHAQVGRGGDHLRRHRHRRDDDAVVI